MTTNFLKLCSQGSANGVAFGDGVSGVGYALGVGKMYTWSVEGATGSGLFVGNGFKTSSWGSSTVSFPLPSSVIKGRISSPLEKQQHTYLRIQTTLQTIQ